MRKIILQSKTILPEMKLGKRFHNWSYTCFVQPSLIYAAWHLTLLNYIIFLTHLIQYTSCYTDTRDVPVGFPFPLMTNCCKLKT